MKIAIVDDEIIWRERAKNIISKWYSLGEVELHLFESGEEYLKDKECYDVTVIDIEMPGKDGFTTITKAREYNNEGIFIILTTHIELSRRGYIVNAFRYIDKTHMEEELAEALESVDILLERNEKISVNIVGEGVRELVLKNIIYVETEKHNILIHTKQGVKKCSNTLSEVESLLNDRFFFRCHNAYIVNLDEIENIEDSIVYVSNGDNMDVSARRKADFKKAYLNRQYECANG